MADLRKKNYHPAGVHAARAVLLELNQVLGAYREHIAVVGGWVPFLLAAGGTPRHVGTLDVDIALDHRRVPEEAYATIHELLAGAGYVRHATKEHKYLRTFAIEGQLHTVEVDLLAGEYDGRSRKKHEHQHVQDVRPHMARGCDLAFGQDRVMVRVEGTQPSGAHDIGEVPVVSIPCFIVMKGITLGRRKNPKDAYDIYYILKHGSGGPSGAAKAMQSLKDHGLAKEAFQTIHAKFSAIHSVGPRDVVFMLGETDPGAVAATSQDAFQQVARFLDEIGWKGGTV